VTAKVLWRDAQGIEGSIELGTQEIRVGRSMDCAIRTDDAMVSRHHARIVWAGAGYMVEDLGSANKVYYQEQVVQQHMLRHGDAVRCGSLWLRFVDTAQLGQPAPAPVAPPAPAPMMPHARADARADADPADRGPGADAGARADGAPADPDGAGADGARSRRRRWRR
jgi:predicted component of type VI protein secretion system